METKETEVEIKIVYNPEIVEKVSEIMSKCDLGISGVVYPHVEVLSFTTTSEVTDEYLTRMEEGITKIYAESGRRLISFERIK